MTGGQAAHVPPFCDSQAATGVHAGKWRIGRRGQAYEASHVAPFAPPTCRCMSQAVGEKTKAKRAPLHICNQITTRIRAGRGYALETPDALAPSLVAHEQRHGRAHIPEHLCRSAASSRAERRCAGMHLRCCRGVSSCPRAAPSPRPHPTAPE